jgi:hypothetical protein
LAGAQCPTRTTRTAAFSRRANKSLAAAPALVVGVQQTSTPGGGGHPLSGPPPTPVGALRYREGKEGGYEDDAGEGEERVGLESFGLDNAGARRRRRRQALAAGGLATEVRPELLPGVLDPRNGILTGAHGDAIGVAVVAVVGIELPALVDQVSIVLAVVPYEIAVLVSGVIDARRAVPEVVVYGVQILKGVIHARVLRREVVVGVLRLRVGGETTGVGVQPHREVAARFRLELGVELAPVLVVPDVLASVLPDVLETGRGDGVFVVVDGPVLM